MKTAIVLVIVSALCGCATIVQRPEYTHTPPCDDPSWQELVSFIGKRRDDPGFQSFAAEHELIEVAKGSSGGFHTDGYAVNLMFRQDVIIGVYVCLRTYYPEVKRTYSRELPYGVSRDDDMDSIRKKFGEPSSREKADSHRYELTKYDDPNMTFGFVNDRLHEVWSGGR
jgi:hypothetical protein